MAWRRIARLIPLALALVGLLLTAGTAGAEMPFNNEAPSMTGPNPPTVGSVLTGHNGSWLYADGSSCGSECSYTWQFSRCTANTSSDCVVVRADSDERTYTVQAADGGRSILLTVTAHKYDCNAHGVDCRLVARSANSSPTAPVAGGGAPPPPPPPPVPTLTVEPSVIAPAVAGVGYSQGLSARGASGPYTFALASGTLPAGLVLAANGAISGTPAQAGMFAFTVRAVGASGATGSREYVLRVDLALAPPTLPDGVTGIAYAQQLTLAGGGTLPFAFRVVHGTLPEGLTLFPTGLLAGTPTKAGTFSFTVEGSDAVRATGRATYSVEVGSPTLTFDTDVRPATSDRPYRERLTVSGGSAPYTWLLAEDAVLPAGVALGRDGVLRGNPSAPAGDFPFDVVVTDRYGAVGQASFVLELRSAVLLIRPTGLAHARVGRAYSAVLRAAGGKAPYRFTKARGRLAAGLRLTNDGRLVGTPRVAGIYRFVVRVADANGAAKTRAYALRVMQPR